MVTSSAIVRPLMPVRAVSEPAKARPGTATGVGAAGSIAKLPVGSVCEVGGELVDVDLRLDLHLGGGAVDGLVDAAQRDAGEDLGLAVAAR